MPPRIDPKTRRLIVSDLTPSVKGEIVTLQEYADTLLFVLSDMLDRLEKMDKTLDNIEIHLAEGSGENLKEDN